ncbi:MAG: Fic family protein [Spirochaetota bacterium]
MIYPIDTDIEDMAEETRAIEGKKRALDRCRPLSSAVVKRLEADFNLEMTFNSNAIEGNTLTLHETDMVLRRGITIGNKTLREHYEARNHEKALVFLRSVIAKRQKFSKELILQLHHEIMREIDTDAGLFRRTQVRILGTNHIPPNHLKVEKLIDQLVEWYYANENRVPAWLLAATVHFKIAHIHPFADGNGRTARLLMNLVLLQKGYPPAVILHVDRKKYYRVLREADAGRPKNFYAFVARAVDRSLSIWLSALSTGKKSEKRGFIPLKEAAEQTEYSFEYLSLLARKGRLGAIKLRRNWVITQEALDEYLAQIAARTARAKARRQKISRQSRAASVRQ